MQYLHFITASLATVAVATPVAKAVSAIHGVNITPDAIAKIAPKSTSCSDGATPKDECRTNVQAAPAIQKALCKYKIKSTGEAAAVISIMAFESAEFKYQKNAFPGRPGQGTRNMQMIKYNIKYGRSIPALKDKMDALVGDSVDGESLSNSTKNAARDLLLTNDTWDFGSAVWYLSSECTPEVRTALQAGTDDGYSKYITECVGTTMTDDRKVYWTRALDALK